MHTQSHNTKNICMRTKTSIVLFVFFLLCTIGVSQQIDPQIKIASEKIESKVIEWRRDFHQNPELSNREFETAKKIAKHLRNLGLAICSQDAYFP